MEMRGSFGRCVCSSCLGSSEDEHKQSISTECHTREHPSVIKRGKRVTLDSMKSEQRPGQPGVCGDMACLGGGPACVPTVATF